MWIHKQLYWIVCILGYNIMLQNKFKLSLLLLVTFFFQPLADSVQSNTVVHGTARLSLELFGQFELKVDW